MKSIEIQHMDTITDTDRQKYYYANIVGKSSDSETSQRICEAFINLICLADENISSDGYYNHEEIKSVFIYEECVGSNIENFESKADFEKLINDKSELFNRILSKG